MKGSLAEILKSQTYIDQSRDVSTSITRAIKSNLLDILHPKEKITYEYPKTLTTQNLNYIKQNAIIVIMKEIKCSTQEYMEYKDALYKFDTHTLAFISSAIFGKKSYITKQQNIQDFSYFNLIQDMLDYVSIESSHSPQNLAIYLTHIFIDLKDKKNCDSNPFQNLMIASNYASCFGDCISHETQKIALHFLEMRETENNKKVINYLTYYHQHNHDNISKALTLVGQDQQQTDDIIDLFGI
jgi:hypothetical protein